MSDQKRGLVSEPVVSRFRGLNRFVNTSELPPDSAQDCLNVICSLSGGLIPLRQPKPIIVNPITHAALVVPGDAMPWDKTLAGNAAFQFADGTLSGTGSAAVSLPVVAGQTLLVSASGTINGPKLLGVAALLGAFTDAAGNVTKPLKVGALMKATAPVGTTQLQLGINDDILADDTGPGWNVTVTAPSGVWSGTVGPTVKPWDPTLPANIAYDFGDHGGAAPVVVPLAINPGDQVTIAWTGGGPINWVGGATSDPNGGASAFEQTGSSAKHTPAFFMHTSSGPDGGSYDINPYPGDVSRGKFPSQYIAGQTSGGPVLFGALIGAFADVTGNVISVVQIGSNRTLVVPNGATQLLFGINDNVFLWNDGTTHYNVAVDITNATGSAQVDFSGNGPCYGFTDYQRADGLRQLVSIWGTKIFVMTATDGIWQTPQLVDDNPDNAAYWSFASSSNILFMANGKRMLKWTGNLLQKWGLIQPTNIPVIDSVATAGAVNLATGRKYRAAYKNSITDTLGTASDASASSGPVANKQINVHIDATADAAADPQIDTVVWYATLDNGFTYYYHSEVPINKAGNTLLVDNIVDPSVLAPTQLANSITSADTTKQAALTGNNWEWLSFGSPQWRTANGPATGAPLPVMVAKNFALNIPANAVITGIKVQFGSAVQSASTNYLAKLQLYKNGAAIGTAKNFGTTDFVIPTTYTQFSAGSSGDLWGLAVIDPAADANNATFGFGVTLQFVQSIRLFLFDFSVFVYYTLPSSDTTTIDSLIEAQLINNPPPVGKYLMAWGGRILVSGMADNPQDVAYSGYEKILDGRVEEAFPQGNRLRISSGADAIRGMGEVQAGVLIGSKSNEMFMLRGELEDVVTGIPLNFTEQLETLPFNTGFASHYAIAKSPQGALYLSAQRSIDTYAGVNSPESMSLPVASLLRDIPVALEEKCIGVFYNFLDKDWYVLAIPYGVGATQPNRLIVIDLAMNAQNNTGIFPFDIGAFDTFAIVEDPASGQPMIVIAQNGTLLNLQVVISGENTLQIDATVDAAPVAQGFWHSGWWGGDEPQTTKLFRHTYLISDGGAIGNVFSIENRLVDDRTHTFKTPQVVAPATLRDGNKGTIGKKSKRCSAKVKFPTGRAGSVQQLWVSYITTGER